VLGADKIGHWFENMVKPYNFQEIIHTPPTRTFEGEMSLMVGGRQVRLIQVGPAHTDGDVIVYVPESKTLYSGDILFIGTTPAMWSGPVENWLSALDRILSMDVDIIVPGHGPITDKDGVRQVEVYLKYINTHVCERYSTGMSPTDAAYDIVLSNEFAQQPFADWNSPERIMLNVHTMYRHLQGRTDHLKVPELSNIMRKQALLAHKLPNAQPTVMRMK
jgi:glyoxylase-like metal-dependent hydrolase (beta-lactamase superfamily II)